MTQIRIRERSRIDKWVDRLLRIGGCCTLDRGFALRMPPTSPDLGNALLSISECPGFGLFNESAILDRGQILSCIVRRSYSGLGREIEH